MEKLQFTGTETGLNILEAREALLQGYKLRRKGMTNWPGSHLKYATEKGDYNQSELRDMAINGFLLVESGVFKIIPRVDIIHPDGQRICGWMPTQSDLFNDDWFIVQE